MRPFNEEIAPPRQEDEEVCRPPPTKSNLRPGKNRTAAEGSCRNRIHSRGVALFLSAYDPANERAIIQPITCLTARGELAGLEIAR